MLKTYSESDFSKCIDYLKSRKHQFHSHTMKGMARGLDPHITSEVIISDLKDHEINVIQVIQMD